MSETLHANLFFLITAIAVVAVTIMVIVALYYVIRILRAVRDIAERVREGSEVIAEDVANVREGIVSGRFFSAVVNRASEAAGFGKRRRARTAEKQKRTDESEEREEEQQIDID